MYSVRIFMKCKHVCAAQKLINSLQNINKPDFPSLADEIVEPHPDMNIKVAAFTVSEKSSIMKVQTWFCKQGIALQQCPPF